MPRGGGSLKPLPQPSSAKPLPGVLAGGEAGSESTTAAPPRKPFWILFGAITIPVIVLDQATKLFVQAHMALYESIVLTVLILRTARISLNSIAFALILGGAAGNLIDRALRGRVIDFMRAHYYDLNYPIFNVADSATSIGVVLIILVSFFGHDAEAGPPKPKRSS